MLNKISNAEQTLKENIKMKKMHTASIKSEHSISSTNYNKLVEYLTNTYCYKDLPSTEMFWEKENIIDNDFLSKEHAEYFIDRNELYSFLVKRKSDNSYYPIYFLTKAEAILYLKKHYNLSKKQVLAELEEINYSHCPFI